MGPRGSSIVCAAIAALCAVVLLEEPPPPSPAQMAARRGEEIFHKEAMCIVCHELGGRGGQNGPRLDHVATKWIRLKGGRPEAQRFFHDHIMDAKKLGPGYCNLCVPYRRLLDEGKIADLYEYLLTLD